MNNQHDQKQPKTTLSRADLKAIVAGSPIQVTGVDGVHSEPDGCMFHSSITVCKP